MTQHFLIVTPDPQDPQERDFYTYEVECPGVTDACRLWKSCDGADPDHAALEMLAEGSDSDPIAHGVRHREIAGWTGWWAATDDCYVQTHDRLGDAAENYFGPGRHPIRWEVGDGTELEIYALMEAGR